MRVLVTGGAGFIGINLVRRLLSSGHSVTVVDDFSTGLEANLDELDVKVVRGCVTDQALMASASVSHEAIVHLAARGSVPRSIKDPVATHAVNASGTVSVLEAARHVGAHVIYASSSSVYGSNPVTPKTESLLPAPMTPYAASKSAGEAYVRAYAHSYDLPAMTFRFFNVYGPWQRPDHVYAAVIPKWIWAAMHGEELVINGSGSIARDFTSVHDVVNVLVSTLEQRLSQQDPVNLAFGKHIRLDDVVAHLETMMGPNSVRVGPPRPGDIVNSQNDPARLLSLFPNYQPLEFVDTLQETIHWLETNKSRLAHAESPR